MQYFLPPTDFISKLDTIDGKTLLTVCHFEKHLLDSKTQFSLGNLMCVIESEKRNTPSALYEAEMFSTECLNQKSEWNLDYFNRLRLALSMQKNEFKYSLTDLKEEPANKIFKVSEVIKKEKSNAEIVLLQLKVHLSSQTGVISSLFSFLITINKKKNLQIKELEVKLEKERKEKNELLAEMEKLSTAKNVFENEVFEKFAVILNEKKNKIRNLKKQLADQAARGPAPENKEMQIEKPRPDEYEIDASQINFGFKGSLFEPTQNYRPNLIEKVPIIRLDGGPENKPSNGEMIDEHLEISQNGLENSENSEKSEKKGKKSEKKGKNKKNGVKNGVKRGGREENGDEDYEYEENDDMMVMKGRYTMSCMKDNIQPTQKKLEDFMEEIYMEEEDPKVKPGGSSHQASINKQSSLTDLLN